MNMMSFWLLGVMSAIGIGTAIALITTWLGGRLLSRKAGLVLVVTLCFAYHAVAALSMSAPNLHFLSLTIMVPFGVGFGSGNRAFALSLFAQAALASAIGTGVYWAMNKQKSE